jgi:ribonuclease-3
LKLTLNQESLCNNLNYAFVRPSLLIEALTHSSLNGINKMDNQRLEFLGDRVLALVISDALLTADPMAREGQLAPRLNVLVKKETCAEVASEIGVGSALLIGRSEVISGGRKKVAILGDAMEAVIAAIYIDGGLKSVRASILKVWGVRLEDAPQKSFEAKSFLQEWAQARGMQPPIYKEIKRIGPDHAPVFNIEVCLENGDTALGTASSKRAAEQEAAKKLLQRLSE